MTIADKIISRADATFNMVFDKEKLNLVEAAGLYGIVLTGRQNVSTLALLYNHAEDADLKALIKQAIDRQTEWLASRAEKALADGGGHLPELHFIKRDLRDDPLSIPPDARFSDREVALTLANMAKGAQLALLGIMHNTYQPYLAKMYREVLDDAFAFNHRLIQLTLEKGWLPHLHKLH